jgi:hypothetical protein
MVCRVIQGVSFYETVYSDNDSKRAGTSPAHIVANKPF